jgi:hypothetical protein
MGYPLGRPHDPAIQLAVIRAALKLLEESGPLPVLRDFEPR